MSSAKSKGRGIQCVVPVTISCIGLKERMECFKGCRLLRNRCITKEPCNRSKLFYEDHKVSIIIVSISKLIG